MDIFSVPLRVEQRSGPTLKRHTTPQRRRKLYPHARRVGREESPNQRVARARCRHVGNDARLAGDKG